MRSFRVVRELRVVKFMLKVCHFATVACWSETVSATGINQKPLVTNRVESDNGAAAVRLRKDRVYRASYPAQLRLVYIYLDDGEWWWWGGGGLVARPAAIRRGASTPPLPLSPTSCRPRILHPLC